MDSVIGFDDRIRSVLGAHREVRLAMLFGSFADPRRPPGYESDIDIAVAGERPLSSGQIHALIEKLALATARPVDMIDLQCAAGVVLRRALTAGRLLLCHDRRLYAELIKRMVFEEADFEPYRRRILEDRRRAWIGR